MEVSQLFDGPLGQRIHLFARFVFSRSLLFRFVGPCEFGDEGKSTDDSEHVDAKCNTVAKKKPWWGPVRLRCHNAEELDKHLGDQLKSGTMNMNDDSSQHR